jgi:hypothetical protein
VLNGLALLPIELSEIGGSAWHESDPRLVYS